MCYMEKTSPILYGVADYAQIRRKNARFLDRTAKIVSLHRLVLVFHGGECALSEEV